MAYFFLVFMGSMFGLELLWPSDALPCLARLHKVGRRGGTDGPDWASVTCTRGNGYFEAHDRLL